MFNWVSAVLNKLVDKLQILVYLKFDGWQLVLAHVLSWIAYFVFEEPLWLILWANYTETSFPFFSFFFFLVISSTFFSLFQGRHYYLRIWLLKLGWIVSCWFSNYYFAFETSYLLNAIQEKAIMVFPFPLLWLVK